MHEEHLEAYRNTSDTKGAFLLEALQITSESGGNWQIVYPLLTANIDKLDTELATQLRTWATDRIAGAKPDEAEKIATDVFYFSNSMKDFPLGDRAGNMEIAMTGYEAALTVFNNDAFPYEWAVTRHNLGNVYRKRVRGNKAENLEKAIALFAGTAELINFDVSPDEWAITQVDLGNAYRDRIQGQKSENLEKAIAFLEEAFKVYKFEDQPYEWGSTQNDLAIAYNNRILGDKAQNLEKAINCYQEALKVATFNTLPYQWAMTRHNLGNAYRDRIIGDKADNIERAIDCYLDALKVCTFETYPYDWAMIMVDLGSAYLERVAGDPSENIERVIFCYQEAFRIRTLEALPYEWATINNNLGIAYSRRIIGDKADNIERAIDCHLDALKVWTFEAFPVEWATAKRNLANTYIDRIRGNRSENLKEAIICCEESLKVLTNFDFSFEWANIQFTLGNIYRASIDYKDGNSEKAIICYQNSLKVHTANAFPKRHAESWWNLGIVYKKINQLTAAYNAFYSSINIIESIRNDIVSGEDSKRKQADYFNEVYACMVQVCLSLGKKKEAIEYLERSKNRNLVEQILSRDLKTIFPSDIAAQLEKYRDEIAVGQYRIQNSKIEDPEALVQYIQNLRQQRNELQNSYLPITSGFQFDQFRNSLDDHTVIIEWCFALGSHIDSFIFTNQTQQPIVLSSEQVNFSRLKTWLVEYLQSYSAEKTAWQNKLNERLSVLAEILYIDEIIEQIPQRFNRLILIPHLILHLFPLHALPIKSQQGDEKSKLLMHRFPGGVSYAPSCQLLQLAQTRKRSNFTQLFAVQNPTGDLDYTHLEVEAIKTFFPTAEVLVSQDASEAAIKMNQELSTAHCVHFSCHGYFNPKFPSESALVLAETKIKQSMPHETVEDGFLTLSEIFGLKLNQCRLITLSACETGWIDINNRSDEYIGLPNGFLVAGSPAVVSSLWTVNDLSTALLMIKFYENLHHQMSLAVALNQAQLWLRDATRTELAEWIKEKNLPLSPTFRVSLFRGLQPDDKPFNEPFHWAAFCAIGQ